MTRTMWEREEERERKEPNTAAARRSKVQKGQRRAQRQGWGAIHGRASGGWAAQPRNVQDRGRSKLAIPRNGRD